MKRSGSQQIQSYCWHYSNKRQHQFPRTGERTDFTRQLVPIWCGVRKLIINFLTILIPCGVNRVFRFTSQSVCWVFGCISVCRLGGDSWAIGKHTWNTKTTSIELDLVNTAGAKNLFQIFHTFILWTISSQFHREKIRTNETMTIVRSHKTSTEQCDQLGFK